MSIWLLADETASAGAGERCTANELDGCDADRDSTDDDDKCSEDDDEIEDEDDRA